MANIKKFIEKIKNVGKNVGKKAKVKCEDVKDEERDSD